MNALTLWIAALILLSVLGPATWAWLALVRVEKELRKLGGFEARDFEIGARPARQLEGARWSTRG